MKKYGYTILVSVTVILFGLIMLFAKKPNKIPTYEQRNGGIALSADWLNSKKAMDGLLAKIQANPDDTKAKIALTQAYMQEARITGDYAYYDKASLELLDNILAKDSNNFDALSLKGMVFCSQHHFAEGLEVAQKAVKLNPYSSFIYGIITDANVELGNYPEAVKMADKMNSLRPDARSYARISYLREIFGRIPQAIQAMKMAVESGAPGVEGTEWTRMILAHLYEISGDLDSAKMQDELALYERPDYPFAYAGLGRIAKANGNYPEAIKDFEKAKSLMIEYSFGDELTSLYRLNSEPTKAEKSAEGVIDQLGGNLGDESQSIHGHYADKELAYAYLKLNPPDLDKALKHALLEYNRRPQNIDVCEALAWVRYKRGEFQAADTLMNSALKTHSKNPVLLCQAGLVKIRAGEKESGVNLIKEALTQDPFLDIDLRNEAAPYVK